MTKLLSKRTIVAAWGSCVLAVVLLCAGVAWADEGQESSKPSNHVYVNQLSDSSFLYQTTIADLAQADSYYEGQTVLVQGEVVGDRINDEMQPDNCWVTLQDDDPTNPSVVSVFMTMEQAKNIDTYGSYGVTGTMLQVRGTFHLVCADHEGQSDLHAEAVTVIAPGERYPDEFDFNAFVPGIVVVVVGLVMLGVFYWLRERQR